MLGRWNSERFPPRGARVEEALQTGGPVRGEAGRHAAGPLDGRVHRLLLAYRAHMIDAGLPAQARQRSTVAWPPSALHQNSPVEIPLVQSDSAPAPRERLPLGKRRRIQLYGRQEPSSQRADRNCGWRLHRDAAAGAKGLNPITSKLRLGGGAFRLGGPLTNHTRDALCLLSG
jgi:hypothetical protein